VGSSRGDEDERLGHFQSCSQFTPIARVPGSRPLRLSSRKHSHGGAPDIARVIMDPVVKSEEDAPASSPEISQASSESIPVSKGKNKNKNPETEGTTSVKRRCVSTACIACRRRKSKCDG
jgi:hypothetical protein